MIRYKLTGYTYLFYCLAVVGLAIYIAYFLGAKILPEFKPLPSGKLFNDRIALHWHIIRFSAPYALFIGISLLLVGRMRQVHPFKVEYGFFTCSWLFMFVSLSNVISVVLLMRMSPNKSYQIEKTLTGIGKFSASLPYIEMLLSLLFLTVILIQLIGSLYVSLLSARGKDKWYYLANFLMLAGVCMLFPLWYYGKQYFAKVIL